MPIDAGTREIEFFFSRQRLCLSVDHAHRRAGGGGRRPGQLAPVQRAGADDRAEQHDSRTEAEDGLYVARRRTPRGAAFPSSARRSGRPIRTSLPTASAPSPWWKAGARPIARRSVEAWFGEERPLGDPEALGATLAELDRPASETIARASTLEIRARYDAETDAARRLGAFGSPTFAVGGEIFWGDDRLEEAIDWAAGQHPAQRSIGFERRKPG